MTDASIGSLCRLTVRAPAKTVDLAVPSDVPVADLLPAILHYATEDRGESGLDHGGWVLQRLGGAPLGDDGTLGTLGLHDGDVVYLRPYTEALPEVRLDDLVDGIANITRDRPHRWGPESSRRLLRTLLAAVVLAALAALVWPGGPASDRAITAAVAGLLLLAGAASASRAVGDAATSATLGLLSAPALALAGWLLPGGEIAGAQGYHVFGTRLLATGAAGAGAAVLALALTAVASQLFLAVAVVGAAGAVSGVLMIALDTPVDGVAAIVSAFAVVVGGFVPSLSFKLAGMRMPLLPTTAQQLQEDIEPYHGSDVAVRTELAGEWMTALYGATGVVVGACLVALLHRPSLPEALTADALIALLLLHGRGMANTWQRLTLVAPGASGALLAVVEAGRAASPGHRPLLVAGLLAVAAVLAVATWTVPGRRMVPYWGRVAELLHTLLAVAVLPLVLWVTGVLAAIRGING